MYSLVKTKYLLPLFVVLPLCISWEITRYHESAQLKQHLLPLVDEYVQQTHQLLAQADAFKFSKIDSQQLRKQLSDTRLAFKKIESLCTYYLPAFTQEHINGAPLLHIKRLDGKPYVVPAEGLQVLDEMIFAHHPQEEAAQIMILAQKLLNQSELLAKGLRTRSFDTQEMIAAAQLELISIFSLGVTGFDTPGSGQGLAEARAALEAMYNLLSLIEDRRLQKIQHTLGKAIKYLAENKDFEQFDRLVFFIDYLKPSYQLLAEWMQESGQAASLPITASVALETENIFDTDFLNPYYFSQLAAEEDNVALRKLGKKLFYDPVLSAESRMSCASCHDPKKGFTDGRPQSLSNVQGELLSRNSPTLLNAVYADRYFYDLRAFSLEQQAEHVIFNQAEFNTAYEEIIFKLSQDDDYVALFEEVSGDKKPQQATFSRALASYVLSLQSWNSPFDQYMRGERRELAQEVKDGFNLFMGKAACGTCHFAPTFAGLVPPLYIHSESEILGVPNTPFIFNRKLDEDMGRYANGIFSEQAWIYERSFKTPTVRNTAVTAPYFHNGAYAKLELVVDFYDQGGGAGMGLTVKNQTLPGTPLHLSEKEKQAIITFMGALTDTSSYYLNMKK